MKYVEISIEEAMKRCKKNAKVLVAEQDLEDDNVDVAFIQKGRNEYQSMFEDVKTVASACDDFVKQLRLFTEKQNIYNIEPRGIQKIILLKEWVLFIGHEVYLSLFSIDKYEHMFYYCSCNNIKKRKSYHGVGAPYCDKTFLNIHIHKSDQEGRDLNGHKKCPQLLLHTLFK